MSDLQHFFAMGGYATYVWSSYALFFLVLIADTIAPQLRRRRVLTELRARLVRQQARHSRTNKKTLSPPPSA